jgi:transposase
MNACHVRFQGVRTPNSTRFFSARLISLMQACAVEGEHLSSRTRRSDSRAAALLRLAAGAVGRTDTALGAFYRRLSARIGKAKAVTATARKIAVLFYNTLRHGMEYSDPGAAHYEERYRRRVITNLERRAKSLGYILQEATPIPG